MKVFLSAYACEPGKGSEPGVGWSWAQGLADRVELTGRVDVLPRTYIYATRSGPGDGFRQFAERARTEPGWRYLEIDSSHNPHVTAPDRLTLLLHDIAGEACRRD